MPRKKKVVLKGAYSRLTPQKKAKVDESILKFQIYMETKRGVVSEDDLAIIRRVAYVEYSSRDDYDVVGVGATLLLEPA